MRGELSLVTPLSWRQVQSTRKTEERDQEVTNASGNQDLKGLSYILFIFIIRTSLSFHSAVQTGVCPGIPVTPAADPGGRHDLALPSGHPAALARRSSPPLSRPGLHSAAGGGRRRRPAEVPASLAGEQPAPLGQYTRGRGGERIVVSVCREICFDSREAQVLPVLVKQSSRCGPPRR